MPEWILPAANDINDAGQIVGYGLNNVTGQTHRREAAGWGEGTEPCSEPSRQSIGSDFLGCAPVDPRI